MTARDVERLIHNSDDLDTLFASVVYLTNRPGESSLAAFSRDEVAAFVSYCVNAVESAPEVPPEPHLTSESALLLTPGRDLFHGAERDSRGAPMRARVNGKVRTWKTRPGVFEIPMKYGFRGSYFNIVGNGKREEGFGYVDDAGNWDNPMSWYENEDDALRRNVSADWIVARWGREDPISDRQYVELQLSNDRFTGLKISVVIASRIVKLPARTKTPKNAWPSDISLDEWRSSGAWTEEKEPFNARGVSPRSVRVLRKHGGLPDVSWFKYTGELAPFELSHAFGCPLSEASDLFFGVNRTCACGVFGDAPRINPPKINPTSRNRTVRVRGRK